MCVPSYLRVPSHLRAGRMSACRFPHFARRRREPARRAFDAALRAGSAAAGPLLGRVLPVVTAHAAVNLEPDLKLSMLCLLEVQRAEARQRRQQRMRGVLCPRPLPSPRDPHSLHPGPRPRPWPRPSCPGPSRPRTGRPTPCRWSARPSTPTSSGGPAAWPEPCARCVVDFSRCMYHARWRPNHHRRPSCNPPASSSPSKSLQPLEPFQPEPPQPLPVLVGGTPFPPTKQTGGCAACLVGPGPLVCQRLSTAVLGATGWRGLPLRPPPQRIRRPAGSLPGKF